MQLNNIIPRTQNTPRMQVGRGGKRGKTSGRGNKGQNARAGHKKRPEIRDIIKKLPKLRGYAFKSIEEKPTPIALSVIDKAFSAGDAVNPRTLTAKGVISTLSGKYPVVKILSNGELKKAVIVSDCLVSAGAKAAIEKAGGKVTPVVAKVTK